MRQVPTLVTWCSVVAAVWGFFLPWAHLELREPDTLKRLSQTAEEEPVLGALTRALGRVTIEVRHGAGTITGELPSLADIPKQVSGAQIPQLANQRNAHVVIALAEFFIQQRQHLGATSYAVYVVPGLALLCGILLTVLGGTVAVALGVAALCAGVAGVGFWKLLTTNTQTPFVVITIGQGLWLSLWAYAGVALGALLHLLPTQPIMRRSSRQTPG